MDVSRTKNTTKMMGNLEVNQDLVVTGKLVVNGKILGTDEKPVNKFYIGDPDVDGCWRLDLQESELVFSQKVDGDWVPKQSMS